MFYEKKEPVWIQMIRNGTRKTTKIALIAGLAVAIPAIGASAFRNQVIGTHSGTIADPTDALTDDQVRYSFELTEASVSFDEGIITILASVQDGSATMSGIFGVPRKNKGPLGWLEKAASTSVRETIDFAGNAEIMLIPHVIDGKVLFTSEVDVDLNKAQVQLFGKAMKVSLRSHLEKTLTEKIETELSSLEQGVAINDFAAILSSKLSD